MAGYTANILSASPVVERQRVGLCYQFTGTNRKNIELFFFCYVSLPLLYPHLSPKATARIRKRSTYCPSNSAADFAGKLLVGEITVKRLTAGLNNIIKLDNAGYIC